MALFAISDLHFSSDNTKSMEVFGEKWLNYMNRIKTNWESSISENDTVLIPGDVSWAMYLEEGYDDFKLLSQLPGKKIITKGNHDYWWETVKKMNEFIAKNEFKNIFFIHNNSYLYEDTLICGSRGWNCPESENYSQEDFKIFNREVNRLKLSLQSGKNKEYTKVIIMIHYPPFNKNGQINEQLQELFKEYNVSLCLYGHLHGVPQNSIFEGNKEEIKYKMVSADYLEFMPYKISI